MFFSDRSSSKPIVEQRETIETKENIIEKEHIKSDFQRVALFRRTEEHSLRRNIRI